MVALREPESVASDAFRTVRTNLFYSLVDEPPKVITVTSPHPHEGKSFACANLSVVLAQAEKNTLVVDCDLRRPSLHNYFGESNLWGIVNILAGEAGIEEVWLEPLPGLRVVSVGPVPLHPAEMLSSRRFAEFLRQAREGFDYVLLDAPPTQVVADAAIVAAQGDGVLLVFDAQHTPKRTVRRSVHALETVGANVLGTIMNNMKDSREAIYQGYTF